MQAAICATSLTSGMRSRRAISESCRQAGIAASPDLEHGLGQLLDEQRHAVGAGDDGVDDLDGQDGRRC